MQRIPEANDAHERMTGKLVWITMGGRLDVDMPVGNRVRTAAVYGEQFDLACRLGRSAEVDIEMMPHPYDPKVLAVRLHVPELEADGHHGLQPQ